MDTMPTPWSPFLGPPWTTAQTWGFALMLALDRAECRHQKQKISWDNYSQEWRIEDAHHRNEPQP